MGFDRDPSLNVPSDFRSVPEVFQPVLLSVAKGPELITLGGINVKVTNYLPFKSPREESTKVADLTGTRIDYKYGRGGPDPDFFTNNQLLTLNPPADPHLRVSRNDGGRSANAAAGAGEESSGRPDFDRGHREVRGRGVCQGLVHHPPLATRPVLPPVRLSRCRRGHRHHRRRPARLSKVTLSSLCAEPGRPAARFHHAPGLSSSPRARPSPVRRRSGPVRRCAPPAPPAPLRRRRAPALPRRSFPGSFSRARRSRSARSQRRRDGRRAPLAVCRP